MTWIMSRESEILGKVNHTDRGFGEPQLLLRRQPLQPGRGARARARRCGAVLWPAGRARHPEDQRAVAAALRRKRRPHQRRLARVRVPLKANNKKYTVHFFPGTQHGFHKDTLPTVNPGAAKQSWERTLVSGHRDDAGGPSGGP
jgi:hypothetical protein